MISVAAVIGRDGTGRFAFGVLAHKPWRVEAAEAEATRGARPLAEAVLAGARTTRENAFKQPLVERTLAWVIEEAKG